MKGLRKRYFKYRPELKRVRCKFRQELQNSPKNSSNFKIIGKIEGKLPHKINRIRVNLIAILFWPKYEQIIWKIKAWKSVFPIKLCLRFSHNFGIIKQIIMLVKRMRKIHRFARQFEDLQTINLKLGENFPSVFSHYWRENLLRQEKHSKNYSIRCFFQFIMKYFDIDSFRFRSDSNRLPLNYEIRVIRDQRAETCIEFEPVPWRS